jgi:hypothetical protein
MTRFQDQNPRAIAGACCRLNRQSVNRFSLFPNQKAMEFAVAVVGSSEQPDPGRYLAGPILKAEGVNSILGTTGLPISFETTSCQQARLLFNSRGT